MVDENNDVIFINMKKIVMEQLGIRDESLIKEDAHIVNDLGADSLDAVELIMAMEEEFKISIPDDDAEKILTIGDAIRYVEDKRAAGE